MARIWTTGYELAASNNVEGGSAITSGGATITFSTTTVRSGTYALRALLGGVAGAAALGSTTATLAAGGTYYVRLYFRVAALPGANMLISFYSNAGGTLGTEVFLTTTGVLRLAKFSTDAQIGVDSSAISTNTWYRLEYSYVYDTGFAELKLDGTVVTSGTSDVNAALNNFRIGWDGPNTSSTGDIFYDDVAINDNSGSFQNTYPGSGKIIRLAPNAAGDANTFATQTGGTVGAANNYTRVSEVTPDDATTFNGSNTLNETDMYNVTDSGIGAADNVKVVVVGARFRASATPNVASFKLQVEKAASGTKTQSVAITPSSTAWATNATASPRTYPIITYQDPDAANWTQTTLDSMQIGMITSTGNTNRADISTVWAMVDYVPAAISPSSSLSPSASSSASLSPSASISPSSSSSASLSPSASRSPSSSSSASLSPSASVSPSSSASMSPSASVSPSASTSPSSSVSASVSPSASRSPSSSSSASLSPSASISPSSSASASLSPSSSISLSPSPSSSISASLSPSSSTSSSPSPSASLSPSTSVSPSSSVSASPSPAFHGHQHEVTAIKQADDLTIQQVATDILTISRSADDFKVPPLDNNEIIIKP